MILTLRRKAKAQTSSRAENKIRKENVGTAASAVPPSAARRLSPRLGRFLLPYPLTDFELHLPIFLVRIDHNVVSVQDFAIQNLQRERILYQFLDRALQRPGTEVRVVALSEQQILRRIRQLDRNLAIGQQSANI